MRKLIRAALVAVATASATPSLAASVVNADGTVTLEANSALTWTFNYNGFEEGNVFEGLTSQIEFKYLSTVGNTFNFSYILKNTSTAPITAARIVAFGFQVDPDFESASVGNGDQFDVIASGNVQNNLPDVNFCLKDSSMNTSQCTSGQLGVGLNGQAAGSFALTFDNADPVTLSNFFTRYQGVNGQNFRGASANGVPVPAIPEPATWAMMIGGFGLIGAAARRRHTTVAYA